MIKNIVLVVLSISLMCVSGTIHFCKAVLGLIVKPVDWAIDRILETNS